MLVSDQGVYKPVQKKEPQPNKPFGNKADDIRAIIEGALIGGFGGIPLGESFGFWGCLAGSLFGAGVTGYGTYKDLLEKVDTRAGHND
jgi:hypothetical protein